MMVKCLLSLLLYIFTTSVFAQEKYAKPLVNSDEMCWWYDQPARRYWEGLPIGTDRFAAMIGGKIDKEDIAFNDETLWSGGPYNPNSLEGPTWKINQYARLEQPEAACNLLKSMLTEISIHPRQEDSRITPSFEGNQGIQGITAGIAEMLLQSHSGEIFLLPALPKAWRNGSITGLRSKGGFYLNIRWKEGKLSKAIFSSTLTAPCRLRSKTAVAIFLKGRAIPFRKKGKGLYVFNVVKGQSYQIISNPEAE